MSTTITFLIKILTRSNVYTNNVFDFLIREFEIRIYYCNIRYKLFKQKAQLPSPFYCSLHPLKVIFHHTNPPRLFWPLPFIVFILQHNPQLIIHHTIRHTRINKEVNVTLVIL